LDSGTAVGVLTFDGAGIPGTEPNILPLENATVLSFTTYRNNPKGRGRIYLPAVNLGAMAAAGRYQPTYCQDLATAGSELLGALAVESVAPTGLHARPVVTGPSDWTAYSVIRQVNVGDVSDVQRRRRNRLMEVRYPSDVTYG
jgi:hypothetical protein